MRMIMTPLGEPGQATHVLYHSILLDARDRPRVALFDPDILFAPPDTTRHFPIITLCAYCARLLTRPRDRDTEAGAWLSAEDYYRAGGTSRVRLSHGICPDCHDRVLRENGLMPSP